jgi:hypothetical protein
LLNTSSSLSENQAIKLSSQQACPPTVLAFLLLPLGRKWTSLTLQKSREMQTEHLATRYNEDVSLVELQRGRVAHLNDDGQLSGRPVNKDKLIRHPQPALGTS